MLVYSVKNLLKNMSMFSKNNSYELKFVGLETKYTYNFSVNNNGVNVLVQDECGRDLILTSIRDLDRLRFNDKHLNPLSLIETKWKPNGDVYERVEKDISYPAQIYITLFNLMNKKVSFVFRHNGIEYRCIYLEGKTMFVEETNSEFIVRGTDLNHLHKIFPDYEILYATPSLIKYRYRDYMEEQETLAKTLGKEFVKYRLDEKVCEAR
ncbi:hypothetical protein UT300012_23340 [Paraclostridium bifermentans]